MHGLHQRPAGATPSLGGDDADESSTGTVILEPDAPVDLGKQRVVLAETHVEPSAELASALPYEDRAAGHDVAVEPLYAEPIREIDHAMRGGAGIMLDDVMAGILAALVLLLVRSIT